jgi:two-component system response regulator VicR
MSKKILIVEDEPPMLQALSDNFKSEGFGTILAKDGEEGLTIALEQRPDLIILDILMPKINGMTVLEKLRENEWGRTVPVIILTNVNPRTDKTLSAIAENQPAYYLIKSDITLDGVVTKVKDLLQAP